MAWVTGFPGAGQQSARKRFYICQVLGRDIRLEMGDLLGAGYSPDNYGGR